MPRQTSWAVLGIAGLQALFQSKGRKTCRKEDSRIGLDCSAVGRNRAPPGHYSGKRGGIPDMGAGAQREARQKAVRADVPSVAFTAGSPWIRRGMAGTGGGGLRSSHHTQAVLFDCPEGWQAYCMAGANPRTSRKPGCAGRGKTALEKRGRNHRLVPSLPFHF